MILHQINHYVNVSVKRFASTPTTTLCIFLGYLHFALLLRDFISLHPTKVCNQWGWDKDQNEKNIKDHIDFQLIDYSD